MLTNYLKSQRPYRPVRSPTPTARKTFCIPIILCCCTLGLCAIIIPLALIPLYIKHSDQGATSNNNSLNNADYSTNENLLFEIPSNAALAGGFVLQNGLLNSTALAQLQTIMKSTLAQSSDGAISTSSITVIQATISDVNTTSRKRRDVKFVNLTEINSDQTATAYKLLNVSCIFTYKAQYSNISVAGFVAKIHTTIDVLSLPYNILSMTVNGTTCTDTVGYSEPITGHTCQTYKDYALCNGTQVIVGSGIDSQLAKENCCYCGK